MKGSCRTDFTTSIFRAPRSPLFSTLPKHQVIFIFMRHRPHHLNALSVHNISSGTFSQLQPLDAVFLHFFGWWLLSLAAVAFNFIWVCNQEAVILPETVWGGAIYTIQTEFTFFTLELLSAPEGLGQALSSFLQVSSSSWWEPTSVVSS